MGTAFGLGGSGVRNLGRRRSSNRSKVSRRLTSKCQRSATCWAWGTPKVMPRVYSPDRSRATVFTLVCAFNHSARVSAVRSSSRSTTRRRWRSTKIVPYTRPRRLAQSSTPRTKGASLVGSDVLRIARSKVSPLVGIPNFVANRLPACPPKANATAPKAVLKRSVC